MRSLLLWGLEGACKSDIFGLYGPIAVDELGQSDVGLSSAKVHTDVYTHTLEILMPAIHCIQEILLIMLLRSLIIEYDVVF